MIELTERQRQEIATSKQPVRIHDRQSNRDYVLVRAEIFERMRQALEAEKVDPSFYEFEETEPRTA
jgi:hypothetical protein